MKKLIAVIATALTLSVLPVSVFAQSNIPQVSDSSDSFNTNAVISIDGYLDESPFYQGTYIYPFEYKEQDSLEDVKNTHVRFYLEDKNRKGMKLVVLDPNGNIFGTAQTNESNNYRVIIEKQSSHYGNYTMKVVSNNGEGGSDYPITLSARSY